MKKCLVMLLMLIPAFVFGANAWPGKIEFPLIVPYFNVMGDLSVGGSLELTDITASGTVTADTIIAGAISTSETIEPGVVWKAGDWRIFSNGKMTYESAISSVYALRMSSGIAYLNNVRISGSLSSGSGVDSLNVISPLAVSELIIIGGLTTKDTVVTLADDALWNAPTGVSGFGEIMIGDNQEWAQIRFTSAGIVTLIQNSTNVTAADTDGNLAIYQNAGTDGIIIKNRLGSSLKCGITIKYYTP